MKRILIIIIALASTLAGIAQSNTGAISGSVADAKNSPVAGVTISLLKAQDSTMVKIAVTDNKGQYNFTQLSMGEYFITATAVNLLIKPSSTITLSTNNPVVKVEPMIAAAKTNQLATVTVSAKKPLIEQKFDRMIVNVDASVTNVGATALEVLEKSPGVLIDKDGNISLKGKPGVLVMIDGKPSYLGGADLANLLSNMPSNQLSQIEIMTNPSAKYDASGNAGVINIKTKKSITQGFNGSITASYGQGVYARSNNSIMLNYRTGNFNTFLNYGYTVNNSFFNLSTDRNFFDNAGKKISELVQDANRVNKSQNNNLKLGLDYYINPKTTIGFVASGFAAPQKQTGFTTSLLNDAFGNNTSIERTIRNVDNTWKNSSLNLNFHTSSADSKNDLSANFDYLHYNFSGNQYVEGQSLTSAYVLKGISAFKNILPLSLNIYSGRVDYSKQLAGDVTVEGGIKASHVNTNNTSDFFRLNGAEYVRDSTLSNSFNYTENISAAYINLHKKFGQWMVQAGLRAENTQYEGLQKSFNQQSDSSFKRNYLSLFPTAYLSYEADNNNTFGINIGRRIDRPVYQQLNPFISFLDKYTYSAGNPFLQPQFSTNVELSHTLKNRFTTTINYTHINGMINETFTQLDSVIVRSVGNIGKRTNIGIAESASIPFTKWYTGTFFANLFQNKYDGNISGNQFKATQLTFAINASNQFTFNNGWTAELSGQYTTRSRDEGQAIVLPFGQLSAGISKSLFKNKGSLKLNVRDIFYTQNPKEIQNFQNIQSTLQIKRDTRVVTLAFVYRFGISAKSKPTNNITDEQKRVQFN